MIEKKIKIANITNIITSYREGFYDRLFLRNDVSVTVYCQDKIPGTNFKSIHQKYGNKIKLIKYISAKEEKVSWQFLPWREICKNYDVIFIGGNPRVLSDALFATFLRFFYKKKIIFWTMAHSFRANALTEKIRLYWSRIFKIIFVYTDNEVDYLRQKGFKKNFIMGMNNGLDQKEIDEAIRAWPEQRIKLWRAENRFDTQVLLLSCARIESKNKFDLVVQALVEIKKHVPNILWCVIGNGTNMSNLKSLVESMGLNEHVKFIGELREQTELAPWFLSSEIFVHPAAIGLSLLHSFGYGLPVITHGKAEFHGPEYAAFEPELTGRNFLEGDSQSLSWAIVNLLKDKEKRMNMKDYSQKIVREKYNVDIMVERFVQIAKFAVNS